MLQVTAFTKANLTPLINRLPLELTNSVELVVCKTPEELAARTTTTEVLLVTNRVPEHLLQPLTGLKWVQALSAGVDQLPLNWFAANGIRLTNAKGVHQIQMSEFAMLQMLQWVRRADQHYQNQSQQVWGKSVPVGELYGKTVGIIGSGSIGQAIATKAAAFGMKSLAYNRSGTPSAHYDETLSGTDGLNRVLEESDFVILLLPSTPETRHFLALEHFQRMRPTACLINLARGSVVVEEDLVLALQTGLLAGACLDVFEQEPLPPESPLWKLSNVIITPHVAGLSPHYMARAADIFYENVHRYLSGEPLRNEVNLQLGY